MDARTLKKAASSLRRESSVGQATVTLLWCLIALFIPRATLYGQMAPFGIGLAAAAESGSLPILVCLCAGYLLADGVVLPLRYLAAVAIVGGLRWVLAALPGRKLKNLFPPLAALAASLATGLALYSQIGLDGYRMLILLAESIVAAGSACFFVSSFRQSRRMADQPGGQAGLFSASDTTRQAAVILTGAVTICAVSTLSINGFSPGRVLAALLVLILSRSGREIGGCMGGVILGAAVALADPGHLSLAVAFSFGGLIAGVFSRLGKATQAAAFFLTAALIVLSGFQEEALIFSYELMAAGILFSILPRSLDRALCHLFLNSQDLPAVEGFRRAVTMRLTVASRAMNDVSDSVIAVAARLAPHGAATPVGGQLKGTALFLKSLADDLNDPRQVDVELSRRVAAVCSDFAMPVQEALCLRGTGNKLTVEILTEDVGVRLDQGRWWRDIQRVCERTFSPPAVADCGSLIRITLTEPPRYEAEIGIAVRCCANEKLCGDANDHFFRDGCLTVIISDGMGSGGQAAVDAAMAVGLTSRLWQAGFDPDGILETVNAALMVKSRDETLATLDVACIDLFSGRIDSYKAGAPATLLCSRGRVSRLEPSSLPIGILGDPEFSHSHDWLTDGDTLLFVSDGALVDGTAPLEVQLRDHPDDAPMQALADAVAEEACAKAEDHPDDVTVIALRLHSRT